MSRELVDGSLFAGRYRILRCIARGGMGAVYEAVHLGTNRHRALKVMHAHLFRSAELRERFAREARVGAGIASEHVVDVFDTGVDEATEMPYLVMELLVGEDLAERLVRLGRLPTGEVLTFLAQVASALEKSHAASIVHRDLKPENLFLTQRADGSPLVKILDFGVAKVLAENTAKLEVTEGVGTPLFMPPEQLGTSGPITSAADIHALGMVAYMLLVGDSYWARELKKGNPYHFIMIAAQGAKDLASERAKESGVSLPGAFDAWFAKMTAFRPEDRYAQAGEAIEALQVALGAGSVSPQRAPALRMNPSQTMAALAAVVLCAAGGGVLGYALLRRSPAHNAPATVAMQMPSLGPVLAPPRGTGAAPPVESASAQASASAIASPAPVSPQAQPLVRSISRPSAGAASSRKKPSLDQLLGQQ